MNPKKVFYMEADYIWGRIHKLYEWRSQIKNYSLTLGGGIHVIDLAMWLLNNKPMSVQAYGNNLVTQNSKFKKLSFIIYILKFPNNVIVKVSANGAGQYNHFHELKIFQKGKTFIHSLKGTFFLITIIKKLLFTQNIQIRKIEKSLFIVLLIICLVLKKNQ